MSTIHQAFELEPPSSSPPLSGLIFNLIYLETDLKSFEKLNVNV